VVDSHSTEGERRKKKEWSQEEWPPNSLQQLPDFLVKNRGPQQPRSSKEKKIKARKKPGDQQSPVQLTEGTNQKLPKL